MFWDNFERLCVKKGVSPNKVCKELGFSNATATHWKQGAKPNNGTVLRVADYFGVTTEELLQDEPIKKEKTPEPLDPDHNVLIMRGRDGSYIRKQLTDEEVRALTVLVSQMKDAPDDI